MSVLLLTISYFPLRMTFHVVQICIQVLVETVTTYLNYLIEFVDEKRCRFQ